MQARDVIDKSLHYLIGDVGHKKQEEFSIDDLRLLRNNRIAQLQKKKKIANGSPPKPKRVKTRKFRKSQGMPSQKVMERRRAAAKVARQSRKRNRNG